MNGGETGKRGSSAVLFSGSRLRLGSSAGIS